MRFGRQVCGFIGSRHLIEGGVKVGRTVGLEGLFLSCQDNGLYHVTEGGLGCFRDDLMSLTIVASPFL